MRLRPKKSTQNRIRSSAASPQKTRDDDGFSNGGEKSYVHPLLSRPPLPTCGAAAWTAKTEKPLSPCVHPSCACAENERMSAAGSDISFRAVAVPHETRRLFVSTFAARFLIWILSQGLFVWPTATAGGKFSKNAFQMIEVFTIKFRFLVPSIDPRKESNSLHLTSSSPTDCYIALLAQFKRLPERKAQQIWCGKLEQVFMHCLFAGEMSWLETRFYDCLPPYHSVGITLSEMAKAGKSPRKRLLKVS